MSHPWVEERESTFLVSNIGEMSRSDILGGFTHRKNKCWLEGVFKNSTAWQPKSLRLDEDLEWGRRVDITCTFALHRDFSSLCPYLTKRTMHVVWCAVGNRRGSICWSFQDPPPSPAGLSIWRACIYACVFAPGVHILVWVSGILRADLQGCLVGSAFRKPHTSVREHVYISRWTCAWNGDNEMM